MHYYYLLYEIFSGYIALSETVISANISLHCIVSFIVINVKLTYKNKKLQQPWVLLKQYGAITINVIRKRNATND